uniref:Uncharacterized protein n=1 Tax=Leptobrachium leishanense TaxID=445787 RepID=A0A8C5MTC8_9ANUR
LMPAVGIVKHLGAMVGIWLLRGTVKYLPPNCFSFFLQEQGIGLSALFMVFLIPSGWILSHLENYKSRPAA